MHFAERPRTYQWEWVSHRDSDILAGAALPAAIDIAGFDAVVVGGADVKTAYLNALRWVERSGSVTPVFWVGQGWEYCGSTIPIPAEVESGDIYLFNHFADFFPIKDPLLVRVTSTDSRSHHERFLLMRPAGNRAFHARRPASGARGHRRHRDPNDAPGTHREPSPSVAGMGRPVLEGLAHQPARCA